MIFLLGSRDDSTTRYFAREATAQGAAIEWIDLSAAQAAEWAVEVDGDFAFREGRRRTVVPHGASIYARLVAPGGAGDHDSATASGRALVIALTSWLELTGGRVVNRPGHTLDNGSKPLHEAWLRGAGFLVPASVTSSDLKTLRDFVRSHRAVVKTISGIRADCLGVTLEDFGRFRPEQGPVHLQEAVEGIDVRVHVVGERVIAVAVRSRAVDYRIVDDAQYFPIEVPQSLANRLVKTTARLGLTFAGWDFKMSDEDDLFYALEVNPMPGYHIYDAAVDGEITRALVDFVEGRA
jgi:hypothetical protein